MKYRCRRATAILTALLAAGALLAAAIPVAAMSSQDTQLGRLSSDLDELAKLANQEVKPSTVRLARKLPGSVDRLQRLREPASTAQAQIAIALSEMQQMKALVADPHYLPALVAAGRAYSAISGKDPLTGTTINPDYGGLEPELAASQSSLEALSATAKKASSQVKRLSRLLLHAKRRANRLEG